MTPSGRPWCALFPTDRTTASLRPPFRGNAQRFISALQAGGIACRLVATRRPRERAYLMHWAWRIAREGYAPAKVPPMAGVDIDWAHAAAVSAAAEMCRVYGLAYRPSLTSHHIPATADGLVTAMDLDVAWSGVVRVKDATGALVALDAADGTEGNAALHRVGASYGVRKLVGDPPHWSESGG